MHLTVRQCHFQLCPSTLGSAEVGVPINCLATRAGCANWRGWTSMAFRIVLPSPYVSACIVLGQYQTARFYQSRWAKHASCPVVLSKIHCATFIFNQPKLPSQKPFHDTKHTLDILNINKIKGQTMNQFATLQFLTCNIFTNPLVIFGLQKGAFLT